MDLLLNIVKQLATTLSPTDFLLVICFTLVLVSVIVKVLAEIMLKRRGLLGSVFGSKDDEMRDIQKKLDTVVTDESLERTNADIKERLERLTHSISDQTSLSKEILSQLALVKHQLEEIFRELNTDFSDLSTQVKESLDSTQAQVATVKSDVARNQELIFRALTELDKMHEFTRNTVPEFRSTLKDLTNDIKQMEKDLALVERSIHLQINNPGIKLK